VTAIPSPFDDEPDGTTPEASGAIIGCECSACRELRLVDDERITFDARQYAAAWQDGWLTGFDAACRGGQRHE
jgi:hypothetical protein